MIDVTESINGGCIDVFSKFVHPVFENIDKNAKEINIDFSVYLERNNKESLVKSKGYTFGIETKWCKWHKEIDHTYEAEYKYDKELLYIKHCNPNKPGVNVLKIDISKVENIFIDSGKLSGCTYMWVRKGDYLYVFHSGGNCSKASLEVTYRRVVQLIDIYNAFMIVTGSESRFAMSDQEEKYTIKFKDTDTNTEIEKTFAKDQYVIFIDYMLSIIERNENVSAGQLIYPSSEHRISNTNTMQEISYWIPIETVPSLQTGHHFLSVYNDTNKKRIEGLALVIDNDLEMLSNEVSCGQLLHNNI